MKNSTKDMFDWTILTLGQFSRNKFWGEDMSVAHRGPICTSVLITGNGAVILTDPPHEEKRLAETLHARTGKYLADITHVYITHGHGDHFMALDCFPNAEIFAAPGDVHMIEGAVKNKNLNIKIHPAEDDFVPGIRVVNIPGHTSGISMIIFNSPDGRVAVVGDAVMTRDFFYAREGYYNSVDFVQSTRSIDLIAESADIVVPGHDNYFIARK